MVTVTVTVTVTRPQVISGGCDFKSRYPAVSDADYDSDDPLIMTRMIPGRRPSHSRASARPSPNFGRRIPGLRLRRR